MKRADESAAKADQKGSGKKDDKGKKDNKKDNKDEKKKGGKKNDKAKQANKAPGPAANKRSCKCRIIVLCEGLTKFRIRVFSSLTKLA